VLGACKDGAHDVSELGWPAWHSAGNPFAKVASASVWESACSGNHTKLQ
jgi:hypothetical protein